MLPPTRTGYESESDYYVAWGEYGRILEPYAAEFGDRLLVLFTNDIQADPAATLDRLLAFLGLETGWRPESLGKTFHKGGGKPWISPQAIKNLAHTPPLSHIYGWVSEAQKRRLRFWIDQLNVRKNDEKMVLSPETSLALRTLYREDAQRLAKIGIEPPWLNDWRNAGVPSTRQ